MYDHSKQRHMRDALISHLHHRAETDRDIMIVTNDFGAPALDLFREALPDQFVNVGISEQNMISLAAGLASRGKKVFVYSIATFLTARAYEQIKVDVCAMKMPVVLVGVGTGYAYSGEGPTHNALEDISIMRTLPHLHIYSPSSTYQAHCVLDEYLANPAPSYVRLERGFWPDLTAEGESPCQPVSLRGPKDVGGICLVATASLVHRALEVAEALRSTGVPARVIDLFRLKPLEREGLAAEVAGSQMVAVLDEQSEHGGLGALVTQELAAHGLTPSIMVRAIPDELLFTYDSREKVHENAGLTTDALVRDIHQKFDNIQG